MTCRELVALVGDYLDGRLARAERERFDAHLAVCPDCRAYVEQVRITVDALGRLPVEDDFSPAARTTLLDAFREWS